MFSSWYGNFSLEITWITTFNFNSFFPILQLLVVDLPQSYKKETCQLEVTYLHLMSLTTKQPQSGKFCRTNKIHNLYTILHGGNPPFHSSFFLDFTMRRCDITDWRVLARTKMGGFFLNGLNHGLNGWLRNSCRSDHSLVVTFDSRFFISSPIHH